jgi:hypothetical protein
MEVRGKRHAPLRFNTYRPKYMEMKYKRHSSVRCPSFCILRCRPRPLLAHYKLLLSSFVHPHDSHALFLAWFRALLHLLFCCCFLFSLLLFYFVYFIPLSFSSFPSFILLHFVLLCLALLFFNFLRLLPPFTPFLSPLCPPPYCLLLSSFFRAILPVILPRREGEIITYVRSRVLHRLKIWRTAPPPHVIMAQCLIN